MNFLKNIFVLLMIIFVSTMGEATFAVPMDWNGELGFDTIRMTNFRRTSDTVNNNEPGSYAINGNSDAAYLQSYLIKLKPNMIINDHVTMKAEISTGKGRGGAIGEAGYVGQERGMGEANFFHTTPNRSDKNNLNLEQVYMELYSETATYKVGRMSRNWGLGALINNGEKRWDRYFSYYEGVEAIFSLGKLYIMPSWSNISNNELSTHEGEIKDLSIGLLYDNPDKDMKFGLYLAKRKTNGNSIYQTKPDGQPNGTLTTIKNSDAKLLDLFMSRYWGNFYIATEIPYISGELGLRNGRSSNFKALGIVVESSYEWNEKWKSILDAGSLTGDQGSSDKFTAMYLHPNYQVAEILFNYNMSGIQNVNGNEYNYESSMTNAMYLKLGAEYSTGLWKWNFAWIYAKAKETASNGSYAYQHEEGYRYLAHADQSNDLGHEFDVSFDYQWNPNLVLSGMLAYYMVGDYYSFNNTANKLGTDNILATGVRLNLAF